jgi:hypothetical protein
LERRSFEQWRSQRCTARKRRIHSACVSSTTLVVESPILPKALLGATGHTQPGWSYVRLFNDAAGRVGMVQLGRVSPLPQSVTGQSGAAAR